MCTSGFAATINNVSSNLNKAANNKRLRGESAALRSETRCRDGGVIIVPLGSVVAASLLSFLPLRTESTCERAAQTDGRDEGKDGGRAGSCCLALIYVS